MRTSVKRIVDGKLYDTETAVLIASDEYWDGHNHERRGRNTHLYRTLKGNFFLVVSTLWQGEITRLECLTTERAKGVFESLEETLPNSYVLAFGAPEVA